jgi:peptide/nickel transport system substrate-binding protein
MIANHLGAKGLVAVAAAGLLAAGLAACGSSSPSSSSSSSSTSNTITMESSPENSITQDFNPFSTTTPVYGMGADGLVYEPLYQFDLAAPPKDYPWLATSYTWSNGGKAITFTIRQGVKFNNGTPMTAADVAFTFNLLKKYPTINLSGLPIASVSSSGSDVTVNFTSSQYTNLENIAGIPVLPEAIWSKVGNPATYVDKTPVGTGPYTLKTFTPQGYTMTKNADYWQLSKVKVQNVYFPDYTSNTGALTALFGGTIEWTGNYIPGLKKDFVDKAPAYHHYYEGAGGDESFEPNLTKWPTNQLPVRKAISLAVSRTLLGSEGEDGLEYPITNAGGLTLPTYSAWAGPAAAAGTLSSNANVAAADAVLSKAGYKKNSSGYYALNGKEVSLTIISPSSYTDMAEVDSIAAQELRSAGIDATFEGLTVDAWNADVADGDFQMTEHWSNGGITPYNMYDGWLNSALSTGAAAKAATGDFERLDDPALDTDLATLASANTVSQQAADLVPLEKYVADNLPVIPLETAAEWFEYNSQYFVGWPTTQDPYDSGQPSGSNNGAGATGTDEVVLLHLSPRK